MYRCVFRRRIGTQTKVLLCTALILGGQLSWPDGNGSDTLSKVKTAYLFNIAKFVVWPGDRLSVVLCVHPDSGLQEYLRKLDSRDIGRSRTLNVISRADMRDGCDIYYSDKPRLADSEPTSALGLSDLAEKTLPSQDLVLTASDHQSALESGYAVQFRVQNGKLRFQFNQSVLGSSSYKVSSKLLVLAGKSAK